MTSAASAVSTTSPSCRPGRVRSTPGCCTLRKPARDASSIVQPLRGYRSLLSPRTAGGPQDYGSATLECRPWLAPSPTPCAPSPASRTKSLRALMTGLLGAPYTMNQASYDLSRLARNQLITRVPHRNLYTLTPDGLKF